MALRAQSLEASEYSDDYGYDTFKEYKKANRGGLRGFGKGAAAGVGTGASTGAAIGGGLGTVAVPGIGTVAGGAVGGAIGAVGGALVGGTIGAISGNRKMKKAYLAEAKAAKEQYLAEQEERRRQEDWEKMQMMMNKNKDTSDETITTPAQTNLYSFKMENGGLNKHVTINVEKGELLVDAKTGEILEDYMDKPKHPEGKHNVDLRGFTTAKEGTVVIPAKYREKYLAKGADRMSLIKEVIANAGNGVKAETSTTRSLEPVDPDDPKNPDDPKKKEEDDSSGNSYAWAAGVPQTALGAYQYFQSKKGLEALEKQPLQMYDTSTPDEMKSAYFESALRAQQAKQRARTGLSADEMAAYKANIAAQSNLAYQRGLSQAGGSLAQAIRAGIGSANVGALNQLSIQDAAMKRHKEQYADKMSQYVDQLGRQIAGLRTQQQNANIAYLQGRRLRQEMAYGAGMQSGLTNVASGTSAMLAGATNAAKTASTIGA